jgi:hypothetical protein
MSGGRAAVAAPRVSRTAARAPSRSRHDASLLIVLTLLATAISVYDLILLAVGLG